MSTTFGRSFRPCAVPTPARLSLAPSKGRERELEQAAVGRLRQTLSSLRRVGSTTPGLEELAWRVRALLPLALPGEQKPLAELSRALLTTGRSAAETDRYLAILDRDSMYRDLREYRELGVTSKRAAEKAEALANRIAHIERLATRRKQVQETTTRLTADIRSLSESIRSRLASRPADLSAELATLRLRLSQPTSKDCSPRYRGSSTS